MPLGNGTWELEEKGGKKAFHYIPTPWFILNFETCECIITCSKIFFTNTNFKKVLKAQGVKQLREIKFPEE